MGYKDKTLKVISMPISAECHDKLNRLWVDLRYSSKQRFSKEIFERAIDGIFAQVYKDEGENDIDEDGDEEREDK